MDATAKMRNQFLLLAYSKRGIPYQWGMDSLELGCDCSGFVRLVLQQFQLIPPGDYSSQMLYDHFSGSKKIVDEVKPGCLLFFGRGTKKISHVALAIDGGRMLEAAGGSHKTDTLGAALEADACVRDSRIGRRYDLVAVADPFKK